VKTLAYVQIINSASASLLSGVRQATDTRSRAVAVAGGGGAIFLRRVISV
jgi:hypothetical protein